jgi:hypothetical protein
MRPDFFDHVERIRGTDKYFDVSMLAISRQLLAKGECELTAEHDLVDEQGAEVIVPLRLNIATRHDSPFCWQLALKLHGIRIDGIDHEPRFRMPTENGAPAGIATCGTRTRRALKSGRYRLTGLRTLRAENNF